MITSDDPYVHANLEATAPRLVVSAVIEDRIRMSKLNAAWHMKHTMPKNATLNQRVRWHVGHARACGCREIPKGVLAELLRLGIPVPQRHTTTRLGAHPGSASRR